MGLDAISRLLDKYNLPWLLLALMSWLIIIFSCSRKDFWYGFPVGIWTMVTGAVLEQFFIDQKFWVDRFIMIPVGELDLYLIIGPFFGLGLLLIRFLPKSRLLRYFSVLAWSALATGIEFIATKLHFLVYSGTKWSYLHSMTCYSIALMSALGFYFIYYEYRKTPDWL